MGLTVVREGVGRLKMGWRCGRRSLLHSWAPTSRPPVPPADLSTSLPCLKIAPPPIGRDPELFHGDWPALLSKTKRGCCLIPSAAATSARWQCRRISFQRRAPAAHLHSDGGQTAADDITALAERWCHVFRMDFRLRVASNLLLPTPRPP